MIKGFLFDWGNTLMVDIPGKIGPMYLWDTIKIINNADNCLNKLSAIAPCYLATNAKDSTKDEIYKALNKGKIDRYIKDIFCYKSLGYEKPSKDFFNSIIKILALNPNELVFIGDDIQKDYYGAVKNGLNAILFDPNNTYKEINQRVNDLLEIPAIIATQY